MIIDKGDVTVEQILESADLENKRVLEIGCGNGRITRGLAGKPEILTAIDPDPDVIESAKGQIADVDFQVGCGESIDFPEGSFDIVLFTLSLHHQDSSKALAESARVLKDDGLALVVEPAVDSEVSIICNVYHDETEVLKRAIRAIAESSFRIDSRSEFYTIWEFTDTCELHQWLLDYYQAPYDKRQETAVNELLGNRFQAQPLILRDKYMMTTLRKHV